MGKYSGIVDKLPRFLGTEPDYQQRVEGVKKQLLNSEQGLSINILTDEVEGFLERSRALGKMLNEGFLHALPSNPLASDYAKVVFQVRQVKDELKAQLSNIDLLLEAYTQLMGEAYEREDITSQKLADGTTIRIQEEPCAVVKDKGLFRQWCINNGLLDSMTLPWMTTNSILKERLIEGENPPPGVEAFALRKTVVTRGRG